MKALSIIALSLIMASCMNVETNQEVADSNELLINLTSDATENAHSTFMGLHFAENALKDGMDVTIFMNVDGVKLLQPGADTLMFDGENIRGILNSIAENDGKVIACPHCMQIHGISKEDLPENFILGEKDVMMAKIRSNPTVFTY
jgi:sulfur relay (sulfurtransferase) complex TusBCD TusD component (DsrE family)